MDDINELRRLLAQLNTLRAEFNKAPFGEEGLGRGLKSAKAMNREIQKMTESLKEFDEGIGGLTQTINAMLQEYGKGETMQQRYIKTLNATKNISQKLADDMKGVNQMRGKEIRQLVKAAKLQEERARQIVRELKAKKKLTDQEEALLDEMENGLKVQKLASAEAEKRLQKEKKIEATLGLSGAAISGIAGALGKIGIPAQFFEDIKDDMYETAKSGSRLKTALTGVGGIFKGLGQALTDPVVIFGSIFKGLKALYDLQGKFITQNKSALLATSGALGKGAIQGMESMYGLFEDLTAAAGELRANLGFIPNMNKKILTGVHMLTHAFGMSGSEATNLFKVSSELGVSLKDMPGFIAGMGGEVEASTGHAVDFQQAMKVLGNTSASVRFNMKGSANELVKAANFAALLGMSMDDIRGAAESTLDFESSIQKEMEAELFLNKQLNLDRFRYAALTGDAATQAEELQRLIAENGPELQGNVLAQQKFADALGISREQLTASLEQMELQKELGFESVDSQKRLNQLMDQGYSKTKALSMMRTEGAEGVKDAILEEERFQNKFKLAQRKFQQAFTILADRIFSKDNMGKIDDLVKGVEKFLFSPIVQGIIKYLPEIAAGLAALSFLKSFNPIQNVGIMNVGRMFGGGMGGPGGSGGFFGRNRKTKGPLTKSGRPDMRYKANRGTRPRVRGRGRGLLGLLGGLGGLFGMNMLMGGGDPGDAAMMTGEDAMFMGAEVGADQVANSLSKKSNPKPKTTPKPKGGGGGFLKSVGNFFSSGAKKVGGFLGGAKDFVMGGVSKVGGAVKSGLNFVSDIAGQAKKWLSGKIKGIFPKLLKAIKKPLKGVLTKIPFVGALLEMLFTGMDVNAIAKSKDMTPQEIYSEAGRSIISGGLGLTMGSLAAAAVSSLQAVGIPGWLLSGAAYMGGDFLGRAIGGAISDHVGGPTIGKAVLDLFGADVGSQPVAMATGGIVTGPVNAIVGEAGNEAVVPLTEFYAQFDRLIAAVQAGGDVYLDGAKVGRQLALSTSKIG